MVKPQKLHDIDPDGPRHVTLESKSIYEDLGFNAAHAQQYEAQIVKELQLRNRMKADLVDKIKQGIKDRSLNQTQAAAVLRVSRPRLSDITAMKTEKFSFESALDLVARFGYDVELVIKDPLAAASSDSKPAAKTKKGGSHHKTRAATA